MARIRVPRQGVTQAELAGVLTRRLGGDFQVVAADRGEVLARRSPLAAAVVRISAVPGATVLRVRGAGFPVVSLLVAHVVADALRRSPELRSV